MLMLAPSGVTMVLPDTEPTPMAITTSLKLPEDLKEKIAELTTGVAQTPHAYMVEAIAEKVDRDEKRRGFLEAGRESLEEFQQSGVAYAHDDVWRYIRARLQGKRAAKPRPIKLRSSKRR